LCFRGLTLLTSHSLCVQVNENVTTLLQVTSPPTGKRSKRVQRAGGSVEAVAALEAKASDEDEDG
jgi:hypothetical protein